MRLGTLGPIEVTNDDGVAVPLGPPKQRALLAALALGANRVVSTERLVDALWSGSPAASAVNLVQGYASKLRRLLGDERVVHRDSGYLLVLAAEELDVTCFERLAREGRALLSEDPAVAARTLSEAVALWRGIPFAELPDSDDARVEGARLEELYNGILEDGFEAGLAVGQHRALISDLEAAVRRHPLRERLRALQMTALYRSGRQADALAAYQDARRVLADELGLDPGSELRDLERSILSHDPSLTVSGSRPAERATPWQLPEELALAGLPFAGRRAELDEVLSRALTVTSAEVVWILGEPGVGKSRFAAEVARRAHEAGALALFGRCDELVSDPYQPFIGALRWFVIHLDEHGLGGALGSDPAPLVRLVPEIGARLPSLRDEIGRVTEVEQYRLFDSVRSWLTASDRPVVLVIDDVHWADRPTLAMLACGLRSPSPGPPIRARHRARHDTGRQPGVVRPCRRSHADRPQPIVAASRVGQ